MNNRKRGLLLFIIYLVIIFTVERFGAQIGLGLTFSLIFYVITIISVITILALSISINLPLIVYIAGWGTLYIMGRWLLYPWSPFWVGTTIYQVISEITLLSIAIALSYNLTSQLNQIEDLGKMISLPNTVRQVKNFSYAIEDIKVEFIRSRRYNHPLSLMIVEPSQFTLEQDLEKIIRDNQKKISRKYMAARLAEVIVHQARRTDMIMTKDWDGRFIVLCPENSSSGASVLAKRIQDEMKHNLGISIQYGIADFPTDALTLDELIRRAETNMVTIGQNPQIVHNQAKSFSEPQKNDDHNIIEAEEQNQTTTLENEDKPLDLS